MSVLRNNRRIFIVLILFTFFVFLTPWAVADDSINQEEGSNSFEIDEKYKGQTPFERMIASIFTVIAQGIYDILQIKDPLVLIFDYEPVIDSEATHVPRDKLNLGIFNDSEMEAIASLYNAFEMYMPIWMVVVLTLAGLMILLAGFTGEQRLTAKQYIMGILVAGIFLVIGPYLMDIIFEVTYMLVDTVKYKIESLAASRGISVPKSLLGVLLSGFMRNTAEQSTVDLLASLSAVTGLVYAVILCLVFVGAGVLNWQYIVRKISLAALIFMFPIIAGLSVFPNTRGALRLWFSEFFSNVFLVLAHAVVYGFLIIVVLTPGKTLSPLEILVYTIGLNSVVVLVRSICGAHQTGGGVVGGIASIAGINALAGAAKVAMGAKDGVKGIANSGGSGPTGGGISDGKLAGGVANGSTSASVAGATAGMIAPNAGFTTDYDNLVDSTVDTSGYPTGDAVAGGTAIHAQQIQEQSIGSPLSAIGYSSMQDTQDMQNSDSNNEKPGSSDSIQRKAIRLGGVATMGATGALVSGLLTGKAAPGLRLSKAGITLADGYINAFPNTKKDNTMDADPNMGVFSLGQQHSAKSIIQAGSGASANEGDSSSGMLSSPNVNMPHIEGLNSVSNEHKEQSVETIQESNVSVPPVSDGVDSQPIKTTPEQSVGTVQEGNVNISSVDIPATEKNIVDNSGVNSQSVNQKVINPSNHGATIQNTGVGRTGEEMQSKANSRKNINYRDQKLQVDSIQKPPKKS